MKHNVLITKRNPDLSLLKRRWVRPEFTADDGIGSMNSLYQATDAIVAIAELRDDFTFNIGSGVTIGPGLMLTATHVLDEFRESSAGPVMMTFLPDGAARAWLPVYSVASSSKSRFAMISDDRTVVSDLSLLICNLHSESHPSQQLCMMPMEIALPVPGTRLWAIGFRQGDTGESDSAAIPLVTSGIVTDAFPQGRGERLLSPCVEVAMETLGGMSGGPVFNEEGFLVGIVSSSFDNGPTYVTLVWDSLMMSIDGLPEEICSYAISTIAEAVELGLVKMNGNYKIHGNGSVVMTLSEAETEFAQASGNIEWTVRGTRT